MNNTFISDIITNLEHLTKQFTEREKVTKKLSSKERKRLINLGIRHNGFIGEAFEIAQNNPHFMPLTLNVANLVELSRKLEELRQLMLVAEELRQLASDAYFLHSDACYHEALRVYHGLRSQARAQVPGAEPYYKKLKTYFARRTKQRKVNN